MSFYQRRQLHDLFENRVYDELERNEFIVRDLTYHTHFDTEIVEKLRYIRTPTALLIRTRADRIIMHRTEPIVAKIEVKTSGCIDGSFAIEAFPLAVHIIEAKTIGAACLYICHQRTIQHEFGFWTKEIQQHITGIYVPPEWHIFAKQHAEWLQCAFPNTPIRWLRKSTQGSNTPYAIIPPSTIRAMAHWQTVLHNWLQEQTTPAAENADSMQKLSNTVNNKTNQTLTPPLQNTLF